MLSVAIALIAVVGCGQSSKGPCPKDQELIDRFNAKEADFEKLATDPENQELLTALGIERSHRRGRDREDIWFTVWYKDFPGPGGITKAYVYRKEAPKDLVDSTDKYHDATSAEDKEVYRHIKGAWYILYRSVD